MKRSRLTRRKGLKRTPLARGTSKLKRTGRLKPISKRKRKLDYASKALHAEYRAEFPTCQCGCHRPGESLHEMFGGGVREQARQHRCCLLHLAEIPCHRRIQYWSKARQLALKLASDPVGFDLARCLEVWGRAPTAILISEVLAEYEAMPRKPPAAADLLLTYEHWRRKVALLTKQLNEANAQMHRHAAEYQKAHSREQKIDDARKAQA